MNFTHTHPPGSNYQINTQILSDIPDPQRVCALASVATVSAVCFHTWCLWAHPWWAVWGLLSSPFVTLCMSAVSPLCCCRLSQGTTVAQVTSLFYYS